MKEIIDLILSVTCPFDQDGRPCAHAPCAVKRSVIELIREHEEQKEKAGT